MKNFLKAGRTVALCAATTALLAACDIRDDLKIRSDGSGTYRAVITVERIFSPILGRIRGNVQREGFRIVDEGTTLTTRFVTVEKEFTDIRALDGPQSSYDLTVEEKSNHRIYRLHATLGAVSGASFDRQFTITMPAKVTASTAGRIEGRRITWFCSNGGTIDVVAEETRIPFKFAYVVIAIAVGALGGTVAFFVRRNHSSPLSGFSDAFDRLRLRAR